MCKIKRSEDEKEVRTDYWTLIQRFSSFNYNMVLIGQTRTSMKMIGRYPLLLECKEYESVRTYLRISQLLVI